MTDLTAESEALRVSAAAQWFHDGGWVSAPPEGPLEPVGCRSHVIRDWLQCEHRDDHEQRARSLLASLAAVRAEAVTPEWCGDRSWDSRYACVKPAGHPVDGPGLTDHDYRFAAPSPAPTLDEWGPGHAFRPDLCGKDVHDEFGMTYASYLVWPRSLMQEMPAEWQHRFHLLAEELTGTFRLEARYAVFRRGDPGRYVADHLRHYRHPDHEAIDAERLETRRG